MDIGPHKTILYKLWMQEIQKGSLTFLSLYIICVVTLKMTTTYCNDEQQLFTGAVHLLQHSGSCNVTSCCSEIPSWPSSRLITIRISSTGHVSTITMWGTCTRSIKINTLLAEVKYQSVLTLWFHWWPDCVLLTKTQKKMKVKKVSPTSVVWAHLYSANMLWLFWQPT